MPYAINLSSRQSVRTLEQAVRHHVEVILYPRIFSGKQTIICHIEAIESSRIGNSIKRCLVLIPHNNEANSNNINQPHPSQSDIEDCSLDNYSALVGTYCDAQINLGENRYLFSSDVVGVQAPTTPGAVTRIALSHPDAIHLAQRRLYRRFQPARSTQVHLRWINPDNTTGSGLGWLCNISENGFACRTELQVTDQLGIGEILKAEFSLGAGDQQIFCLDAILCSKMPAGTQGKMILGLQFANEVGDVSQIDSIKSLRQQLLSRFATLANATERADT